MTTPEPTAEAVVAAREAWWPFHVSRTRKVALAQLDDGDIGEVTLAFEDFVTLLQAERDKERDAVVAYLMEQSDTGADYGIAADKGSTRRAAYGGGSLALKRAAESLAANQHRSAEHV